MKKHIFLLLICILLTGVSISAQNVLISDDVAYSTPDASAVLDIYSESGGLLIPRMTSAQRLGIIPATKGLLVYDETLSNFYYKTAIGWSELQEGFWQKDGDNIFLEDNSYKVGIGTNNPTSKFEIVGDNIMDADSALFRVKNKQGKTIFAVYDGAVRIYIDTSATKGRPKGFAVGGISSSKETVEEYLRVTRDSTRVYVNTEETKGRPKGFAVGGLSSAKGGNLSRFLHLVPDNYFIGHQSGIDITSGLYNSILGYQSARHLTEGNNNTFLGYQSGFSNTTGNDNTFLGYMAGYGNTTASTNVAIGKNAGKMNQTGESNVLIGNNVAATSIGLGNWNIIIGNNSALHPNFDGISNVMIGDGVGGSTTTGANNVFIGDLVATANSTGSNNIFVGANSGKMNTVAENNIFIGSSSGYSNTKGSYNVFFGYKSGYDNLTGANNLFLGYEAGRSNTQGNWNTFIGYQSGYSNTIGHYNLFLGYMSGTANTTGADNLFIGTNSGRLNSTSGNNTFIGHRTGFNNTSGDNNMFIGPSAGYSNTSGDYNHFIGKNAGYSNTGGRDNLFIGDEAGRNNTTGSYNMFIGSLAGNGNKTGSYNMIMGYMSGQLLDATDGNILIGYYTGYAMTSGFQNIIIGSSAGSCLIDGGRNIMIGTLAGATNVNGFDNIFIGYHAGENESGSNTGLNAFFYFSGSDWMPLNSSETELWQTDGANVFLEDLDLKVGIGTNSPTSKLDVFGDNNLHADSALFRVKNKDNQTVFAVYHDGVRIYVGEGEEKGRPKGFAVGGMSSSKAGEEYFRITRDSARIWLNTEVTKGYPKGFAVGGLSGSKNSGGDFLSIDTNNCFIGINSGMNNQIGATFEGKNNVCLGTNTALENIEGYNNVFIGNSAGLSNINTGGNVYIGTQAARDRENGMENVVIGYDAALGNGGDFMGNVIIGKNAGFNSSGNFNLFLGYAAGMNQVGDSKFIISGFDPGMGPYELIAGDFQTQELQINAITGIGGAADFNYQLSVYGNAWLAGTWFGSDKKWKKNINTLNYGLDIVTQLQPVTYDWRVDEYAEMNFTDDKQIGFIAQDVELLVPELVKTDTKGNKAISYSKFTPILVKAIQEQQKQIETLENNNIQLNQTIKNFESEIELLKIEIEKIKNN